MKNLTTDNNQQTVRESYSMNFSSMLVNFAKNVKNWKNVFVNDLGDDCQINELSNQSKSSPQTHTIIYKEFCKFIKKFYVYFKISCWKEANNC